MFGGVAEFRKWAASHCDVARLLGARMGLPEQIQLALRHLYERWDGKGMPGELRGAQIPLAVRVMQVAQDADMAWQRGGAALAGRVLAGRAGSGLDPQARSCLPRARRARRMRASARHPSGRRRCPPSPARSR